MGINVYPNTFCDINSLNTLPAKDGDVRLCDGMFFFHIHMLQTKYVHIA